MDAVHRSSHGVGIGETDIDDRRIGVPRAASLGLRPLPYRASIVVILGLSKATSHIKSG